MTNTEKNKGISATKKATLEKRKSQYCKVFKFKVDKSSLNTAQKEHLIMFFNEAKWCYNYILGWSKDNPINDFDYKELKNITKLDKDNNIVPITIGHIGSSVKQNIVEKIKWSLKGLSILKKNGYKVGALKFKSEYNSIPLKQYGVTHKIEGSKFKIQGIKKPIKINGLKQLSKYTDIDYANANLLFDGIDYFIALTCYIDRNKIQHINTNKSIGIDFGCTTSLTLSDTTKIDINIKETERLKKLQRKLERQKKGSNNRNKTKLAIRKEYRYINNKKNDIANKITHTLLTDFDIIVIQDDNFNGWKDSDSKNEKIQHSVLGRIKSKLESSSQIVLLERWFPTTKQCTVCGTKNEDLKLEDRTFKCPKCGLTADRDVHAAQNMLYYYNTFKDASGTDGTSKPVSDGAFKLSYRKFLSVVTKQEDTIL